MEELIAKLKGLAHWQIILLLVLSPLVLAIVFLGGSGFISAAIDKSTRKKVDAQSTKLDQALEANQSEIDKSSGRLEKLEADKAKAVASAEDDDAVAFHNGRKKD